MSLFSTRFGGNASGLPGPSPLPPLTSALSRRAALFGAVTLAALPEAGLPTTDLASASFDPFAAYHGDILTLHAAVEAGPPEEEAERLMDRWAEIDRLALTGQPTTLAGALGALQMARREYLQFQMSESEDAADPSKRLVLHLIDGALAVLHRAAGGGVA